MRNVHKNRTRPQQTKARRRDQHAGPRRRRSGSPREQQLSEKAIRFLIDEVLAPMNHNDLEEPRWYDSRGQVMRSGQGDSPCLEATIQAEALLRRLLPGDLNAEIHKAFVRGDRLIPNSGKAKEWKYWDITEVAQ